MPTGVKCEPFGIREGGTRSFDAVTSADNMRSAHTSASTHPQLRWVGVSAPCLANSALATLLCRGMVFTHPPSCPAFPWTGFASPSFHGPCTRPRRYYAGSDSCCASPTQQVSLLTLLRLPNVPPPTTWCARLVAFIVASARPVGRLTQASPSCRELAATLRRIGFVILQAIRSLPAALHPASRRRSCLQLHATRPRMAWTLTTLTDQSHRRTARGLRPLCPPYG